MVTTPYGDKFSEALGTESDMTENFFHDCSKSLTSRNADIVSSEPHPNAHITCNKNIGSTHCLVNQRFAAQE